MTLRRLGFNHGSKEEINDGTTYNGWKWYLRVEHVYPNRHCLDWSGNFPIHPTQTIQTKESGKHRAVVKPHRRRRLSIVLFLFVGSLTTVLITIFALKNFIDHFYSPDQIVNGEVPLEGTIKTGGRVKPDSLVYDSVGLGVQFDITDLTGSTVRVHYVGILPSLFREGAGTIVTGRLNEQGVFIAKKVHAKHDENYVPPELEGLIEYDDP